MSSTKKALLIGINYTSIPEIKLNGCIDDVVNVRNVLIDAYDYSSANITMLRDDFTDPAFTPTRDNILQCLSTLAQQSSSLDEIWVHYSGHGSQINNLNISMDGNPNPLDSILVPIDYQTSRFILEDDLLAIIQQIKCRAILMFDCCHSGSICELPYSVVYKSPTSYANVKNNNVVVKNPNIFVFSGCKDNQTCADTYNAILNDPAGAFTNTFIECLRNSRHNTSLLLLYRDICVSLANAGFTQTPVLSLSRSPSTYVLTRASPIVPLDSKSSVRTTLKSTLGNIIAGKR
jgi:hypothetical protein